MLIVALAACDVAEDRPAEWSYIHAAIIGPSCATSSCHSRISSVAGMDLSTPARAYALLTGRTCGAPPLAGEVGPEYIEDRFMAVLRGRGARSNGDETLLMPPDQPLADVEIELIARWVAAGAPCD